MKKTSGLGKGLGSLIPGSAAEVNPLSPAKVANGTRLEVSVDEIEINPRQPRTHFSPSHLEDLIASIKTYGILQPLVVTKTDKGYQLIAGERRLRSAKAAGLEKVPVIIRTATEQEKLELALIENIQRHDLNPVEEARAYRALMDSFDLTQEEVSKRVGKSRSSVANAVRLLDLNDEMLEALTEGEITRSHARALLAQSDPVLRNQMFLQMLNGDMTVREAETMASTTKPRTQKPAVMRDPNIEAHERTLEQLFGTKVRIDVKSNGKGKMQIQFYSQEEFHSILDLLGTVAVS